MGAGHIGPRLQTGGAPACQGSQVFPDPTRLYQEATTRPTPLREAKQWKLCRRSAQAGVRRPQRRPLGLPLAHGAAFLPGPQGGVRRPRSGVRGPAPSPLGRAAAPRGVQRAADLSCHLWAAPQKEPQTPHHRRWQCTPRARSKMRRKTLTLPCPGGMGARPGTALGGGGLNGSRPLRGGSGPGVSVNTQGLRHPLSLIDFSH